MLVVMTFIGFTSCRQKSKLESEAEEVMNQTFHKVAKDPSSVKIDNVKTAFCSDSLCIIHLDLSAKNGFGLDSKSQFEYIYLVSDGKKYESYQELNRDSVYLTNETFEKEKIGKIYEKLSYEEAMYYRAVILINNQGRAVGDNFGEKELRIPVPTGTGLWEIHNFSDEFGEETGGKYLSLTGKGTFSNSATTNSELSVIMFVTQDAVSFKFLEYGSQLVKGEEYFTMRIKNSKGNIQEIRLFNDEDGNIRNLIINSKEAPTGDLIELMLLCEKDDDEAPDGNKILRNILGNEGIISCYAEMGEYSKSKYIFKLDLTGFNKAIKFL